MTTSSFLSKISTLAQTKMGHGQREGQALFNALYELDPEMANMIRSSHADPFYDDSLIPAFWGELA